MKPRWKEVMERQKRRQGQRWVLAAENVRKETERRRGHHYHGQGNLARFRTKRV